MGYWFKEKRVDVLFYFFIRFLELFGFGYFLVGIEYCLGVIVWLIWVYVLCWCKYFFLLVWNYVGDVGVVFGVWEGVGFVIC